MNKEIVKAFKRKGLSLQADAMKNLTRQLQAEEDFSEALGRVLDTIRSKIDLKEITSSVITGAIIENVVLDMTEVDDDLELTSTQVIDAFSCPSIKYNELQKTYTVIKQPNFTLHGDASSRAEMYRSRYLLVQQRLIRSGRFSVRTSSRDNTDAESKVIELSSIESLLGDQGVRVLLGFLTQPTEGVWHLEDGGAMIPLDLTGAIVVSNVLITQGSIVIVEGALCDGIFRVSQLGAPPPEDRDSSLTNMNVTDPFGNNTRSEQLQQMLHLESASIDTMFIVISDLHLDQEQSLDKLKLVFSGFESFEGPPPVFVLMGDFVSQDFTRVGGRVAHLEAFHQLADVIAAHTRLCANAKFILAPGPADMGLNTVLPRRRLPDMIRQIMDTKVINSRIWPQPRSQ